MTSSGPQTEAHYLALPAGEQIGPYNILRMLGQGGFSLVYLARDEKLQREVALKEYLPSQLATRAQNQTVVPQGTKQRQAFEEGLRRFVQEAQLLAQLNHPAIVRVLDLIETRGTAYIAMPYYHGQTLKDYQAATGKRWNQQELITFLNPLLDALALLHQNNILHRDISPDNIFLLENNYPVLIDFGAARRVVGEMTESLTLMVKSGYSPIEQYSRMGNMPAGPWSDVYSLGAVIYELVCGKTVYAATDRVSNDQLPDLKQRKLKGFNKNFIDAIDWALAVNPNDRPQVVGEWFQEKSDSPKKPSKGWRVSCLPYLIAVALLVGWQQTGFHIKFKDGSIKETEKTEQLETFQQELLVRANLLGEKLQSSEDKRKFIEQENLLLSEKLKKQGVELQKLRQKLADSNSIQSSNHQLSEKMFRSLSSKIYQHVEYSIDICLRYTSGSIQKECKNESYDLLAVGDRVLKEYVHK